MAIRQALLSTSRFRVGCVIAKGRRILSAGFNQMDCTHPAMGQLKRIHAEVHALAPYHGDMVEGTAYVCRILADGRLGLARPCPVCLEAFRLHGVRTVHYTTNEGNWIKETI